MKPAVLQQLVKFLVVGGSSFVIDLFVRMSLLYYIPLGPDNLGGVWGRWLMATVPGIFSHAHDPHDVAYPFAAVIAAAIAMVNSFVLNRSWTFQIRGSESRLDQAKRFVVVSLIGAGINVGCGTILNILIPGESRQSSLIATVIAAVIAAGWNFYGQRRFAFRTESA